MKISINILIFFLFLFCVISEARADMVYLKNGYQIGGIIKAENDEYVELEVNAGTVKFYRKQIERVEHSSREDKKIIQKSLEEERAKNKAQLQTYKQAQENAPKDVEVGRQGNHIFVNALLNGRVNANLLVDTGASFIVLSPEIAKKLNINLANAEPDVKMSLADGREVLGKMISLDSVSIKETNASGVQAVIIYKMNAFQGFDGVLGMSFLKLFKFEIDLNKNKLTFNKL